MKTARITNRKALALLGLAAAFYTTPALTPLGEARASGALIFTITDPLTVNECDDCHVAFDPGLLKQEAWKRVMADLSNHFGEDATLPESTRRHIEDYLVTHAQPGDGPVRVTEQRWFKRSHRRLKAFAAWEEHGEPHSLAHCGTCHGVLNAAAR